MSSSVRQFNRSIGITCTILAVITVPRRADAQCNPTPAPIDGRNIKIENTCVPNPITQDNPTGFGDLQSGFTNGSELDLLYVSNDLSRLYVGVVGNTPINDDFANTLIVFIQTQAYSNLLSTTGALDPASAALRAMNNIQLDGTPTVTPGGTDGFAPNFAVQYWRDGGGEHCVLTKLTFGGSTALVSSTNDADHQSTGINYYSVNLRNERGVNSDANLTAAQQAALARTAKRGWQFSLDLNNPSNDLSLLPFNPPDPSGIQIQVMACIVSAGGCVSNQFLPPLPAPQVPLPSFVCSAGCLGNYDDTTVGMENRISLSDSPLPTGEPPRYLGDQFMTKTLVGSNAGRPLDYSATIIPQAFGDQPATNALATQDNYTCFQDAQPVGGPAAVGSELDQMFIKNTNTRLKISITGNLENTGRAYVLLLDVNTNGVNGIIGQSSASANRDFAICGGSDFGQPTQPGLNNLTLDCGFAPDYAVTVQRDAAAGTPDDLYNLFIRNLNANTFRFLGRVQRNAGTGELAPPAPNQNGSELDQMFVRADATNLYIGITGNLEPGQPFGNSWIVFLDTNPNTGMNPMATSTLPNDGRWNALRNINGDALDAGFAPDYAVVYLRTGNTTPALAATATLINLNGDLASPTSKTALTIELNNILGPNKFAADNLNAVGVNQPPGCPPAGVTAAQQSMLAATAERGLMLAIARSSLDSPENGTTIGAAAYLISGSGYWSNQLLPGVGVDAAASIDGTRCNLAFAPNPTLPTAEGNQFTTFTLTTTTPPGRFDGTEIPTSMGGVPIATQNNFTQFGDAQLPAGSGNANCTQVGFDNSNIAGVTDTSAANAATATSGMEFDLAYADIGLAPGQLTEIKVLAILTGRYGYVSNQTLPGLGVGGTRPCMPCIPNLGNTPLDLSDAATVAPGNQVVAYMLQPVVPHDPADVDGNGVKNSDDLTTFIRVLLQLDTNPQHVCNADINGRDGPDGDDIQPFVNAYY